MSDVRFVGTDVSTQSCSNCVHGVPTATVCYCPDCHNFGMGVYPEPEACVYYSQRKHPLCPNSTCVHMEEMSERLHAANSRLSALEPTVKEMLEALEAFSELMTALKANNVDNILEATVTLGVLSRLSEREGGFKTRLKAAGLEVDE